ncbi:MAG: hypothetical protein ABI035_13530 [Gemmatimonadaceae bacterium]
MNSRKSIALVISVVVVAMVASAWALGALMGPTDNGMRCTRTAAGGSCELLRTTFFGLFGNSAFTLPESTIRSATYECPTNSVGARHSSACAVFLTVASGDRQLVSSYALPNQAEAAAKRINNYLGDRSVPSLEVDDSVATPVLLYACLPVLVVLGGMGIGLLRRRARRS